MSIDWRRLASKGFVDKTVAGAKPPQEPAPHATSGGEVHHYLPPLTARVTSGHPRTALARAPDLPVSGKLVNGLQIILKACDRDWNVSQAKARFRDSWAHGRAGPGPGHSTIGPQVANLPHSAA
jgi:hypothetical protein